MGSAYKETLYRVFSTFTFKKHTTQQTRIPENWTTEIKLNFIKFFPHASLFSRRQNFAGGYMFYRQFFFLVNRPTCDQTANRRRVESIPVLRTYVWHE